MPEQLAQYEEARTSQSSITMDTLAQDTTTDKVSAYCTHMNMNTNDMLLFF